MLTWDGLEQEELEKLEITTKEVSISIEGLMNDFKNTEGWKLIEKTLNEDIKLLETDIFDSEENAEKKYTELGMKKMQRKILKHMLDLPNYLINNSKPAITQNAL